MSAFFVGKKHVIYLVSAAITHRMTDSGHFRWWWSDQSRTLSRTNKEEAANICNMLLTENCKSLVARYDDRMVKHELDYTPVQDRELSGSLSFEAVQLIKAIHCYQYQSCEHDGWKDSEAKAFTESLLKSATRTLRGYSEAEWGVPA